MKLFLIRHGETVDNVRGVYAGITDSALTQHGVLQANRLGQHLADRGVKLSHIFSSDLQRAFKTAEAIRSAQPESSLMSSQTKKFIGLREQDFGYYEGRMFHERTKGSNQTSKEAHLEAHRNDPDFKDVEFKDAMKLRADIFIDEHLLPLLKTIETELSIVIVAHGIILAHLWRCVLRRFPQKNVSIAPGGAASGRDLILEHLGGWSNTGYLELEISQASELPSFMPSSNKRKRDIGLSSTQSQDVLTSSGLSVQDAVICLSPQPSSSLNNGEVDTSSPHFSTLQLLPNMKLVVIAVNCLEHLKGLKKTRGGIGSAKYDENQKTIQSFFKKRKTD